MARIIITGASDGIGAEMARQLAQTHGSRLQLTLAATQQDYRPGIQVIPRLLKVRS